jgi:hypothetical protein
MGKPQALTKVEGFRIGIAITKTIVADKDTSLDGLGADTLKIVLQGSHSLGAVHMPS